MSERKIVDYEIVYEDEIAAMMNKVNSNIRNGYIPFGGLCVTESFFEDNNVWVTWYYQAMVKYSEDE